MTIIAFLAGVVVGALWRPAKDWVLAAWAFLRAQMK